MSTCTWTHPVHNADRIIDYDKYFTNNSLRLIIEEVPDSDHLVIDDDDDQCSTSIKALSDSGNDADRSKLTMDAYQEQVVLAMAENMTMAYNADGIKNEQREMSLFEKGFKAVRNTFFKVKERQIDKSIKIVEECAKFDLCFLVDCTGSMQKHIDGVKNRIREVLRKPFKSVFDAFASKPVKFVKSKLSIPANPLKIALC